MKTLRRSAMVAKKTAIATTLAVLGGILIGRGVAKPERGRSSAIASTAEIRASTTGEQMRGSRTGSMDAQHAEPASIAES